MVASDSCKVLCLILYVVVAVDLNAVVAGQEGMTRCTSAPKKLGFIRNILG